MKLNPKAYVYDPASYNGSQSVPTRLPEKTVSTLFQLLSAMKYGLLPLRLLKILCLVSLVSRQAIAQIPIIHPPQPASLQSIPQGITEQTNRQAIPLPSPQPPTNQADIVRRQQADALREVDKYPMQCAEWFNKGKDKR